MTEMVRTLWQYQTGAPVFPVAMTADGAYIVSGSDDGFVYCWSRDGTLLWRHQVHGTIFRLALSAQAERIVVGTWEEHAITLLDREGRVLWQHFTEDDIWGVALTHDGRVICGASLDHHVYLWNEEGHLLWKYRADDAIRNVAMTPDGEYIVAGADNHRVYMFDQTGHLLWQHETGNVVWSGARITADGTYVIAGSNDHHLYLLDSTGTRLWRYQCEGNVNVVAITPNGSRIAAGANQHVYCLDTSGVLQWQYQTDGEIYGVALSDDGRYLVAASYDKCVYLFNSAGEILYRYKADDTFYGACLSSQGRYFAVCSRDHHVYLFENLHVPEERPAEGATVILGANSVRHLRRAYTQNPYFGLGHWFDTFDRYLHSIRFEVCAALLQELREQGYPLTPPEMAYVESREGALWLRRGLMHHQARDYEQAADCYQCSLEFQRRAGCRGGEGQVMEAVSLLDEERQTGQHDPYLGQIAQAFTLLGDSGLLLCQRLIHTEPPAWEQILLAALQLRLTPPLLQALESDDTHLQMMAIAALDRLSQVEESAALQRGIEAPHGFIRWKAVEVLSRQQEVATWDHMLCAALERETDPEVRLILARTLGHRGNRDATPALLSALNDADPSVRWAVATALEKVGDRRALPSLRQVSEDKDFLGQSIHEAAQSAVTAITERYPLPTVHAMATYRLLQTEPLLSFATLYQPHEMITCLVTLSETTAETRLALRCHTADGSTLCVQEGTYADLMAQTTPLLTASPPDTGVSSTTQALVELVDDDMSAPFACNVRVRCIEAQSTMSGSVHIGDQGVVQRVLQQQRLIGVAWDRDVGGHDGNGYFICRSGHGWFVPNSAIITVSSELAHESIRAGGVSFSLEPPTTGGWLPGEYGITVSLYDSQNDIYEYAAEAKFRVVSHVEFKSATLCLEVDATNSPLNPASVILTTTPIIYCSILIYEVQKGVQVTADLYGPKGRRIERQVHAMTDEGKQYIAFCWRRKRWSAGAYRVQLQCNAMATVDLAFSVVSQVAIHRAILCQELSAIQEPVEIRNVFTSEEERVCCSVLLSETPPATKVVARWVYAGRKSMLITESSVALELCGSQYVGFSLSKPKESWPVGSYEIYFAVVTPEAFLPPPEGRLVKRALASMQRRVTASRMHKVSFTIVP